MGSNMLTMAGDLTGGAIDSLLGTSTQAGVRDAVARLTSKISNVIMGFANSRAQSRGTYNLKFGPISSGTAKAMEFYNYICESAAPQFSLEVDDDGYPIWGSVRLSFASVFSANVSHFPMRFPSQSVIKPKEA